VNNAQRVGLGLLILGIGILAGFGLFLLIKGLLGLPTIPLIVKVAVSVIIVGVTITLISLAVERLRGGER
jgi:hypothetical protein